MGLSLVWFGVITVVGAEIGLLTPPFGLSCFVIKTAVERDDISLNDIFLGAFPFAVVMLAVLIVLIVFPQIIAAAAVGGNKDETKRPALSAGLSESNRAFQPA